MALPLAGIRVLDLTTWWAGPLAAMLLADLGAEVIKIEAVQKLDPWRGLTFLEGESIQTAYERSPLFNAVQRNKLGITLNLASEDGQRLFSALVKKSQVVLENYSPRVMRQFGLHYDALRRVNPAMVLTSISGFGQGGPWRDYVSFATVAESLGGITDLTGYGGEAPLIHGVILSDPYAAFTAAFATLAALEVVQETGEGQHVDVSQLEASIPFVADAFMDNSLNGRVWERNTNRHRSRARHGCYPCRGDDQWISISVGDDEEWGGLCEAMGWPAWSREPRFQTADSRLRYWSDLEALLADWTRTQDKASLTARLQRLGVPAAPVLSPAEHLSDPRLQTSGYFQVIDREQVGPHPYPSLPVRFNGRRPRIRRPAPTLGQHNRAVLQGLLGLEDAEVERLVERGVIGWAPAWRTGEAE